MSRWPAAALVLLVAAILAAQRHPVSGRIFRWLPIPLWCYALPAIAVELGWLPAHNASYPWLTAQLLPVALGLLLLGADLPSVWRSGSRVLAAALVGTLGIILGAALGARVLHAHLPPEAWKGAGALAGTWTGGTMNLLALRTVLEIPDPLFAPLIVVDAVIAYTWMALLVAASAFQRPINRWLGAAEAMMVSSTAQPVDAAAARGHAVFLSAAAAVGLSLGARALAQHLPVSSLASSTAAWTILLVTTIALLLGLIAPVRRIGVSGDVLGYPCLYVVLAATGAQANLGALWSTPVWLLLGLIIVVVHGVLLLFAGRLWRIPLGLLATASQADIGGVVSAPIVAAVYHQSLAPVGLLLAIAGNALGTYFGLLAASCARWVTGN